MRKIPLNDETKRILKIFAIFFGMIFGMTAILVTATRLSRNSWNSSLAFEMQCVLDSYSQGTYTVEKNLQLDSTLSTSSAVYALRKHGAPKNQSYYGIIVRVPSILGPLPAVFVYTQTEGAFFAGYAIDNGKAEKTVNLQITSNVLKYWEDMIPTIIEKVK